MEIFDIVVLVAGLEDRFPVMQAGSGPQRCDAIRLVVLEPAPAILRPHRPLDPLLDVLVELAGHVGTRDQALNLVSLHLVKNVNDVVAVCRERSHDRAVVDWICRTHEGVKIGHLRVVSILSARSRYDQILITNIGDCKTEVSLRVVPPLSRQPNAIFTYDRKSSAMVGFEAWNLNCHVL